MAEFLLVHGSGHGAWGWRDMLPLLNANGHTARAIDLPAHGDDKTPVSECSLDAYAGKVIDAIQEPVILVGHSLAGMTISAVAEKAPEKLRRLVYITAWLPGNGDSARDMRAAAGCPQLVAAMEISDDRTTNSFAPHLTEALFYGDCPPGTYAYAAQHLCPEPLAPQREAIVLGENFAGVAKSYIRCHGDQAIPVEAQMFMSDHLPQADRYDMACAHSPFFADPGKLAEILFKIAKV